MEPQLQSGQRVVFIGDSITDAGRNVDREQLGSGYVRLIRNLCTVLQPQLQIEWINKGISGNQVTDLQARWQTDVIGLQPDCLSISIGVNDVWRQIDGKAPGVDIATFERTYRAILEATVNNTQATIIVMEPSLIEEDPASEGNQLLQPYVRCVRQLATEYKAVLVPIHAACLDYLKQRRQPALTTDGVHLAGPGMALFASKWLKAMGLWY